FFVCDSRSRRCKCQFLVFKWQFFACDRSPAVRDRAASRLANWNGSTLIDRLLTMTFVCGNVSGTGGSMDSERLEYVTQRYPQLQGRLLPLAPLFMLSAAWRAALFHVPGEDQPHVPGRWFAFGLAVAI